MNIRRNQSPTAQGSYQGSPLDPRSEIVEYLRAHPEAADTVEGIVDWWLPMQRYENAKTEIQQALHELVEQGLVEEVTLGNGNRLFRLPSGKGEQA